MIRAEGGAAGGHRGGHPGQMGGHDVRVSLDDDDTVIARDVALGQIQAVEHLALVVDRGLGGVEVLGDSGVLLRQASAAESDGGAGDIAYGPHETIAEAVVDPRTAGAPLTAQARGDEFVLGEAPGAQHVGQAVPAGGGVADPEMSGLLRTEGAPAQESAPRLRRRSGQLLAEPHLSEAIGLQEALTRAGLDAAGDRAAALLVAQLNADPPRQVLHGLGEGQAIDLLDEGDDITALAAAEAVPQAQLGADVEGGGALIVKGAQSLQRAHSPALEGDVLADDVLDLRALAHRIDVLALDESRHGVILGERRFAGASDLGEQAA